MSVFHAYDIRGLAPQELDETFASRLGRALVTVFSPKKVLIGRDMRLTSPALEAALVESLVASGVDVTRIGLCSTPVFNVLVGLSNKAFDLGIMVTASHNPGKYNGFKLVRSDVSPIGQGSGMEELAEAFRVGAHGVRPDRSAGPNGGRAPHAPTPGTITDDPDALKSYIDHIIALANLPADMPRIKVAIDAGNGMAGAVLPELLKRCPWIDAQTLYLEPDGNFPNHEANPLKVETLHDLSALVVKESCALGVAFDGDADRIGFEDETGAPIPGDLMAAFVAQEMLQEQPGGIILFDVRSSWAVADAIRSAGGEPRMCRVGHAYIKRQMREEGAIFGGEVSMHYYFHNLFNVESGDLLMLLILKRLVAERKTMSTLWKPLQTYAHSGEINFKVSDVNKVLKRVRDAYGPKATSTSEIDGIRLEFRDAAHPENDWWFSLRASNTEPLIRLNLETRSIEQTKAKVEELTELINAV